ncbi:MAG: twin-arginine translocase subunit TatC, partial [Thaumarchaeota archaeon]|nr:twin-arginine translocase subunit TatC [Nitrososphaerota archaeon]
PFTIGFLYGYAAPLVDRQFITIDALIGFTLLFLLAFGLSFQIPIIMWATTKAGIVDKRFWRRNFSYAILAIVVFGAAITPDGSGITMWLVAIPLTLLYLGAYLFIRRLKET